MRLTSLTLIWSVMLAGCAGRSFYVDVNSLVSTSSPRAGTYVLMSGMKDVGEQDLQFQEVRRYLDRVLRVEGYQKADSFETAQLAIFIAYGIGEPKLQQYSYSLPVYGTTGGGTTTYSGTSYGPGGTVTTMGTATTQARTGVVGYTSRVGSYTTFTRYLSVAAVDLQSYREEREIREAWKTSAVSTGSSGDLREVLPFMVTAVRPYMGKDTGKAQTVVLSESDRRVKDLVRQAQARESPQ